MARFRQAKLADYNNDRKLMPELLQQPGEDLAQPGLAIIVYGADWEYKDVSDNSNGGA